MKRGLLFGLAAVILVSGCQKPDLFGGGADWTDRLLELWESGAPGHHVAVHIVDRGPERCL